MLYYNILTAKRVLCFFRRKMQILTKQHSNWSFYLKSDYAINNFKTDNPPSHEYLKLVYQ